MSLKNRRHRNAFTLVELLVVIGIIALLISILLPALSSAKRQAAAAKCAAQLREIGNAFQMYAAENKQWYPPSQLVPTTVYNIGGVDYTPGAPAYWINFLQKYVTKSKAGTDSATAAEAGQARSSILWGCPEWQGYQSGAIGGINRVQTGFGMNNWPTHAANYPLPPTNQPPNSERAFIQGWNSAGQVGNFFKQVVWGRRGSERCLVSDSLFWEVEAQRVPPPNGMVGQAQLQNSTASGNQAFAIGNTLADCYRHGKYPKPAADGFSFQVNGGQVGFNILYADGHVSKAVDRTEAFKSMRLRYPE